ncbi:MAG: formylglycine-generating enzyme family protein [Treponema sp.]|nr:formylglycine-generating enzyme family protein [Treponema sp.]
MKRTGIISIVVTAMLLVGMCGSAYAAPKTNTAEPEGTVTGYDEPLYKKGQAYEDAGKYIHALGTYWDAMEAAPEKGEAAMLAFVRLNTIIQNGKPGKDIEYDEFDLYDGWVALWKDFVDYWTTNNAFCFSVVDLTRKDLDMEARTATYRMSTSVSLTFKFQTILDVVQSGNEISRGNGWKKVPSDFWNEVSGKFPALEDFVVTLDIKGNNGQTLCTQKYSPRGISYEYDEPIPGYKIESSKRKVLPATEFTVDSKTMKVIDSGNIQLVPVSLTYKGKEKSVDYVKWDINGGMHTNIRAPNLTYVVTHMNNNRVRVGNFYIMKTEVTEELYEIVTLYPSYYNPPSNHPAIVTWNEAVVFSKILNSMLGLTGSENQWRLPTEVEWQQAADDGHEYSGSNNIDEVAWYRNNSGQEKHAVATKKPNSRGIYDMSGNAAEWCEDLVGSKWGNFRAIRGGGSGSSASECTVYDHSEGAESKDIYSGFRLVCNIDEKTLSELGPDTTIVTREKNEAKPTSTPGEGSDKRKKSGTADKVKDAKDKTQEQFDKFKKKLPKW